MSDSDTTDKVRIVAIGAGYRTTHGEISPISVLSYRTEVDGAEEFGKFIGSFPNNISTDSDIEIPRQATRTWNIKMIKPTSTDLFIDWSEEFSRSNRNTRDLSQVEILSFWLRYTGNENIRLALLEVVNSSFGDE